MAEEKGLAKATDVKTTVLDRMVGDVSNTKAALEFGQFVIDSGMAPKHVTKPASVVMQIQMGAEIGLSPAQSLFEIVMVNGLPTIKGDAAKALVMQSGMCEKWDESYEGDEGTDGYKHVIIVQRKGSKETIASFSIGDAKKAGLWNNISSHSPWNKYPKRMLRYRNVGFVARDIFPDIMKGFKTEEEALDFPKTEDAHATIIEDAKTASANIAKEAVATVKNKKSTRTVAIPVSDENPVIKAIEAVIEKEGQPRDFEAMKGIMKLFNDMNADKISVAKAMEHLGLAYADKEALIQSGTKEDFINVLTHIKQSQNA